MIENISSYDEPHYEISIGEDHLVAMLGNGKLYAINLTNNNELWILDISGPMGNSGYTRPIIIVDGAILVTRYNYDEEIKWHHREIVMIVAGEADIDDSENYTNHVNFPTILLVVVLTTWAYRKRW